MKHLPIPKLVFAAFSIFATSCTNPDLTPTAQWERATADPNLLPRDWLKKRVDPDTESKRIPSDAQQWYITAWNKVFNKVTQGEEVWYWESNKSEPWYYSGYCRIHDNQITSLITWTIGTHVD